MDPFRPIVENAGYLNVEKSHLDMLGLTNLFEPLACPAAAPERLAHLEEKVARLNRELGGLQWLQTQALLHPPGIDKPGLRQFVRTWRNHGLRTAWRRFVEHVERGI